MTAGIHAEPGQHDWRVKLKQVDAHVPAVVAGDDDLVQRVQLVYVGDLPRQLRRCDLIVARDGVDDVVEWLVLNLPRIKGGRRPVAREAAVEIGPVCGGRLWSFR